MLRIIVLISITLTSLLHLSTQGNPKDTQVTYKNTLESSDIALALKKYVHMYIKAKGSMLTIPLEIKFKPLVFNRLGECNIYSNGTKVINIDTNKWITLSEIDRKVLVFHELAHCDLGREEHTNTKKNGKFASIMNFHAFKVDPKDWNMYVKELFSKQK